MSYESLIQDLITSQRDFVGESAAAVARDVAGLTLTDDGGVDTINGDPVEVVDALVTIYEENLGLVATSAIESVAEDYRDDLELPRSLQ